MHQTNPKNIIFLVRIHCLNYYFSFITINNIKLRIICGKNFIPTALAFPSRSRQNRRDCFNSDLLIQSKNLP